MNKLLYFLLSFIIGIFTIFISLFLTNDYFYVWLTFSIIILILPLILHKIFKGGTMQKEWAAIFIQAFILCFMSILFLLDGLCSDNYIVAATKSSDKANEIQEFLTNEKRQTMRSVVWDINNEKTLLISVKNSGRKENHKATIDLLKSNIMDDSVELLLNHKYTKNPKKLNRRAEMACESILYDIEGVKSVVVNSVLNSENAKVEKIEVYFETETKTANNEKIEKLIEKFMKSVSKQSGAEIEINDRTYNYENYTRVYKKAQEEFENKNYLNVLKILKEAKNGDSYYDHSIEKVNKIIKLNEKIKFEPDNPQNYINLGDLLSPDFTVMPGELYDYPEGIKNYRHALKFNVNQGEIYEKIGNAYSSMEDYEHFVLDRKRTNNHYGEKAVENYLKALEFSKGSRRTHAVLGSYYLNNKNYSKALEHYNKVDRCETVLPPCDELLAAKKVYLNLKTGNFKEAHKEAENCSKWFCRIIRFNFGVLK